VLSAALKRCPKQRFQKPSSLNTKNDQAKKMGWKDPPTYSHQVQIMRSADCSLRKQARQGAAQILP
jgi:hypothetical protein